MKTGFIANAALLSLLLSGYALADDDCSDPVSDWQPRETLRQQVARQYGARYMKQKPDSDGRYAVDHSSYTYVIGADGKLAASLPYASPPQHIVDAIRAQLGAAPAN